MSNTQTQANRLTLKQTSLAMAVSLALSAGAFAQESEAQSPDEGAKKQDLYEQIIVTGTASGKAVRKVDTSFATTSLSAEDIKKLVPKSTADVFKAIPGVWAESSGGVSGANVFVRGFPSTGDAPFLTLQLQGVPVFQPPTLSFLENSTLFRVDETISFMDGLRGGPNSVVSNGQPGLTTNFLLKEGGPTTEGLLKYTTSSYDLQRLDGVLSGELAEDFYYMIGGYVQQSPGIRDAGFNSEKGQQFTINLTKELDNGKLNFFTRVTDDHGAWYLPTPLVEGVDNEYTQLGTLNRQATIQYGPDGTSESFDFGEGRGWEGSITGGSINLELGNGWTFVDRFAFTKGDADTLGLVPNGSAVALSEVADNGSTAIGAVTGTEYNGSTLVQQIGRWVVRKEIESFTNDLALTKAGDSFEATIGLYASDYSAKDWWSLGNQSYHVIAQGGENLTGIDCNDNADSCGWNYDINSAGDGKTTAFYGAVDYQFTDQLSADIGLRFENHEIEYSVDEGLDGVITKVVQYDESDTSWTTGLNYQFENNSGVFLRASEGSKMPYFDDFRDNYGAYEAGSDLIFDVTQYEFGYKLARNNYNLYATAFFNESESSQTPFPSAPSQRFITEAMGVEVDAAWFNDDGLSVTLNATIQDTEITESDSNPELIGNEVQRQPGWQLRVTPNYDFEIGNFMASAYANVIMVDDRYSNNENTVVLEGYEQLDVGFALLSEEGLKFELSMQNITDEDGLTEGDPRNPTAPNGRFIMPRTATFSVSYEFY
ncbi:TonB-dependent receptor [Planctobacterium marinum]|uniref:TonB-dependent receptor n=1 Tax=Planctobacterium marinum TaxID=1631968 RepID=A0AA48HNZ2_9ALTE|nr:TonB-dependent receptor [Planctobacterium marinum]